MRLKNGETLLNWPLALHVLTAGYYYNSGGLHQAIDLRTNQDGSIVKPVYAAEDGTVDQVQAWDGRTKTGMQSYGNMVRIRHADYGGKSLQTRYAHLSSYCVKQGEQVREGQLIGYTGQTGNVYGAHLHFEVIWGGVRRNPLVWLDDDFTTATGKEYTYGAGEHAVARPAEEEKPMEQNPMQRLCIVGEDADIRAKAEALGLPVQTVTATLIGPASEGDAMTLWAMTLVCGKEYFSRYPEEG